MAQLLMEKVRTSGRAQEIGPLNPYARRIVHLTVAEDKTLSSESIGDAFLKTVVICEKVDYVNPLFVPQLNSQLRNYWRLLAVGRLWSETCSPPTDTIVAIATPPAAAAASVSCG